MYVNTDCVYGNGNKIQEFIDITTNDPSMSAQVYIMYFSVIYRQLCPISTPVTWKLICSLDQAYVYKP